MASDAHFLGHFFSRSSFVRVIVILNIEWILQGRSLDLIHAVSIEAGDDAILVEVLLLNKFIELVDAVLPTVLLL